MAISNVQVMAKLDEVQGTISEVAALQREHCAAQKIMCAGAATRLGQLETFAYGNGKRGAKADLQDVVSTVSTLRRFMWLCIAGAVCVAGKLAYDELSSVHQDNQELTVNTADLTD